MLGDASDFTPLDLLGSLALNAVGTNMACKQEQFRVGVANSAGTIPPYADFRFLGGVASALAAQWGGPMVRRAGHDAAVGLLGSFVATETCRRHAEVKMSAPPAQAAPAQGEPAQAQGAPNYSYGW